MLEDMRDTLVVIVSGYGDPMDDMFSYNLGLPSRFPHHFVFEDFGAACVSLAAATTRGAS